MTATVLSLRYRNVLILLARHIVAMRKKSEKVRDTGKAEFAQLGHINNRIAGLYAHAHFLHKQSAKLRDLLLEDNKALKHFFGTTDLNLIANRNLSV